MKRVLEQRFELSRHRGDARFDKVHVLSLISKILENALISLSGLESLIFQRAINCRGSFCKLPRFILRIGFIEKYARLQNLHEWLFDDFGKNLELIVSGEQLLALRERIVKVTPQTVRFRDRERTKN